jgi:tRNA pseudouridine38-40 synthase
VIEGALERLHGRPAALTGSGRTDSGVHAAGQVANFYTDIDGMEAPRFTPALNSMLPGDVRILRSEEAAADFHSRFDAKARTYRYHIIPGRPAMPWELRYGWQTRRRPGIDRLNRYAALLLGERDCSLFAVPRDKSRSRSRHISAAAFFPLGDTLVFEIRANAFLWKMVRSVLGTLIYYEGKGLSPEAFKDLLASGDRRLAGPTAPPQGLFLWKIDYYRL